MKNTNEIKVKEIYTENGSDSVMIIREYLSTGYESKNYIPVPAWTDTKSVEKAAKVIARIIF